MKLLHFFSIHEFRQLGLELIRILDIPNCILISIDIYSKMLRYLNYHLKIVFKMFQDLA